MAPPKKKARTTKGRGVYTHNAGGDDLSTASTASRVRVRTERNPAPPPSPEKRRPYDAFDVAMGMAEEMINTGDDIGGPEGPAGIKVKTKKKKPPRNLESDGLLRREGRGPWWAKGCMAPGCLDLAAEYRCEDCFGGRLLCKSCMVDRHRDEPLHIIQRWLDEYFQPCSLGTLDPGLRSEIGHPPGEECDFRKHQKFVMLDNNAIHKLEVDFCGCLGSPSVRDQLLNIGWFPATTKEPETAATLLLLRRFHALNLQGRVPAYDFYNALEVLSECAGMIEVPDRREQFSLMVREYRHLQMAKRRGCGHDAKGVVKPGSTEAVYGIDASQPGELSIPCRACPHPGINLEPGWEDLPADKVWIHQLMLSEDANFKMKGRATSSREVDPTLGPGFAYMVANEGYLKHLAKYVEEDEISHCIAFAALWRANNKWAKGLQASGIGSVSCSRHEMFHANRTGDLQRGEWYSNMDYLWFLSVMGVMLLSIVASYDIACQWSRNFWERMKKMPAHLWLPSGTKVQFKVPKFHLPPHVKKCHGLFSLNYTKWVGRTDGEGVERNWSWLNMAARSISVMGPGSRDDTIDDFCGFSNWQKTVGLGNSLLCKMVLYIPKAMLHNRAFQAFTEALREGHEGELLQWERDVKAWEQDPEMPCPYDYPKEEELSMEQVRLRIAEEEHARVVTHGKSSTNGPGTFVLAGLEIEGQQETIRLEARRRNRTSIQATELQRKRTLLLSMIGRFRDEQAHFMPGITTWLADRPVENKSKPEDIQLYLPSSFPRDARATMCVSGLPEEEDRLRQAQAVEGLWQLRWQLRTRTFAHTFKRKHTASQAMYTKSQALQSVIEARIKAAMTSYRMARVVLLALRGPGDWELVFQELRQHNIQGMNERALNEEEKEDDRRACVLAGLPEIEDETDEFGDPVEPTVLFNLETGEGRRVLSWIWYTAATGDWDIRIEWTKAKARADRWREELIFLEEEMRRILAFCVYKANWWHERKNPRPGVSPELAEGLRAYVMEQEAREHRWKEKWEL
ncbi:hypothetical protein FB451DRAFT_1344179 [Mycena latifolia]|nr:hypothetical protein FB451DRAFT_1344179 [Mycena latifolia]